MKVTIRFFANLRETTGTGQLELDMAEGASLVDLVDTLIVRFPDLDGQQAMWHFAVNQTHAELHSVLRAGDRIAIFPYVAGG